MNNLDQKLFDELFRKFRKTALVYLRSSKSKNENYDPFRETGFDQTNQNPLPVKVLPSTMTPGSLTHHEMGLAQAGSIKIIIQDRDVELIKNSEKITLENIDYYAYKDAVGQKLQIFPTQFAKYSRIILSRKDVGTSG